MDDESFSSLIVWFHLLSNLEPFFAFGRSQFWPTFYDIPNWPTFLYLESFFFISLLFISSNAQALLKPPRIGWGWNGRDWRRDGCIFLHFSPNFRCNTSCFNFKNFTWIIRKESLFGPKPKPFILLRNSKVP